MRSEKVHWDGCADDGGSCAPTALATSSTAAPNHANLKCLQFSLSEARDLLSYSECSDVNGREECPCGVLRLASALDCGSLRRQAGAIHGGGKPPHSTSAFSAKRSLQASLS